LYLYSIKIQTDIDQNTVIKLQKITYFFEIIFEEFLFERARPGPKGNWAKPIGPTFYRAGLSPAQNHMAGYCSLYIQCR